MFSPQTPHFNYFAYCYVALYSAATDESVSKIKDGAIHQLTRNKEGIKTNPPGGGNSR